VFIAFATFLAMYLIAGTFIRLFTMKFPNSPVSNALMFAH
jgi:hypothetical protein